MYAQCVVEDGINKVIALYNEQQAPCDYADFCTGDVEIPEGVDFRKCRFIGDAVDGATGIITEDYETPVKQEINSATDAAIAGGFTHNSVDFRLRLVDQLNGIALFSQMLSGADLTGQRFRAKGQEYNFIDNNDFVSWFATGMTVIQQATAKGAARKDQLKVAGNDKAAIDALKAQWAQEDAQ